MITITTTSDPGNLEDQVVGADLRVGRKLRRGNTVRHWPPNQFSYAAAIQVCRNCQET